MKRGMMALGLGVAIGVMGGGGAWAQSELVGAWVGQAVDPTSGTAMKVEYALNPDGTFQKSFAMQVGMSGGFDWIAGRWFTQGDWLRLEVLDHYSSHSGNQGPLPAGELWQWRPPQNGMLMLTHALCVQQQLNRPDCVLTLRRAQ